MPLKKGKSKKVIGENIAELHHGKTFAKTKAKFGKTKANKQAIAIAFSEAGKSRKKKKFNAGAYEKTRRKHFGLKVAKK